MPFTSLDSNVALVAIDIQKGIVAMNTVHPSSGIVANVVTLADAFRARMLPVVLVHVGWSADFSDAPKNRSHRSAPRHIPEGFSDYVDDLRADPARDILIHKRQWGAFYGTDLDLQLRRRGVTNIVLCGISTSIGVESTARNAWEHGYNISFVTDAMTDGNSDAHERAIDIIFPRLGELGTTDEILAELRARPER